jgi:hypothetical protein
MRRLLAAGLAALGMAACASPARDVLRLPTEPSTSVPFGADFTLAPGESVVINDGAATVRFTRVAGDSRCPTDMLIQCIWAGSVQLALTVTASGSTKDVAIETVPTRDVIMVDHFAVQLIAVTPTRRTTDSIPVGVYRAVFRVTKR